ncbi:hypothetical protein FQA39_LY13839 [Lamprigera yunnana]|nr:hypothetical protein FQA39_LY13839 [Lamprigera yunnana]
MSTRKFTTKTSFSFLTTILILCYLLFLQLLIAQILLDLYLKSTISMDKIFKTICRALSTATVLQYATILNLSYWKLVAVNDYIRKFNVHFNEAVVDELNVCKIILQEVYEVCQKVERIFGNFLAIVFFLIFIEYLETMFAFLATYWMLGIKIVNKPEIEKLTLWEIILNNFLATVLHCYVSFFFADVIRKQEGRTNDVLEQLCLRAFSRPDILKAIYGFHQQLNHNKFVFTAAKFIELGWQQAFAMFGGVITYSIVSSQLYLNVKQTEFDSAKNFTNSTYE